jgi:hypothetical protein
MAAAASAEELRNLALDLVYVAAQEISDIAGRRTLGKALPQVVDIHFPTTPRRY